MDRRLSVYTECSTLFPFDVLQEMLCGMSTVNCEFSREQGGFSNCVQLCTRQQQLIKYLEYVPLHLLGVVLLITLCGMVCLHSG